MYMNFKKGFQIGEQELLKEEILENKLSDKLSNPYTISQIVKNNIYLLEGPNRVRFCKAVNGGSLETFIESKYMASGVDTAKTNEYFKAWENSRKDRFSALSRRV